MFICGGVDVPFSHRRSCMRWDKIRASGSWDAFEKYEWKRSQDWD